MAKIRLNIQTLFVFYSMDDNEYYFPSKAAELGLLSLKIQLKNRLAKYASYYALNSSNGKGPIGRDWKTIVDSEALKLTCISIACILSTKDDQIYSVKDLAQKCYADDINSQSRLEDILETLFVVNSQNKKPEKSNLYLNGSDFKSLIPTKAIEVFLSKWEDFKEENVNPHSEIFNFVPSEGFPEENKSEIHFFGFEISHKFIAFWHNKRNKALISIVALLSLLGLGYEFIVNLILVFYI